MNGSYVEFLSMLLAFIGLFLSMALVVSATSAAGFITAALATVAFAVAAIALSINLTNTQE